jgi:hypothetical protein
MPLNSDFWDSLRLTAETCRYYTSFDIRWAWSEDIYARLIENYSIVSRRDLFLNDDHVDPITLRDENIHEFVNFVGRWLFISCFVLLWEINSYA